MPQFCSAFGCTSNSGKIDCKVKNISFHRFPLKDPVRLKKWLTAVKRENFVPSTYSVLCSEHFNNEDFALSIYSALSSEHFNNKDSDISFQQNRRYLKTHAVPSKFNYSKASMTKKKSEQLSGPQSKKKYLFRLERKRWHPPETSSSNIPKHRFVPILPAPSKIQIPINHNASPYLFTSLSTGNKKEKNENRYHQNEEQSTNKLMEASDTTIPFEPEIILKIGNDAILSSLEETGEKLNEMDNDNSSCNANDLKSPSSEEILEKKLDVMTALYQNTWKKLKRSQERCKHYVNSSCNTNNSESLSSEEILKQKLESMTALYEKTQKKLKLSQEQCDRYVKQVISLEQIIDNLRQIISVSDFN